MTTRGPVQGSTASFPHEAYNAPDHLIIARRRIVPRRRDGSHRLRSSSNRRHSRRGRPTVSLPAHAGTGALRLGGILGICEVTNMPMFSGEAVLDVSVVTCVQPEQMNEDTASVVLDLPVCDAPGVYAVRTNFAKTYTCLELKLVHREQLPAVADAIREIQCEVNETQYELQEIRQVLGRLSSTGSAHASASAGDTPSARSAAPSGATSSPHPLAARDLPTVRQHGLEQDATLGAVPASTIPATDDGAPLSSATDAPLFAGSVSTPAATSASRAGETPTSKTSLSHSLTYLSLSRVPTVAIGVDDVGVFPGRNPAAGWSMNGP